MRDLFRQNNCRQIHQGRNAATAENLHVTRKRLVQLKQRHVTELCNKKGHYSSVCRSSKVREVQVADEACHFLGSVHHFGEIDTTWTAVLYVDGNQVKFKLDTGAVVSVVGERFADGRPLQSCDKLLKVPGDTPLQVWGVFQAKLSYKDTEMWETLHDIQGQHQPLLSASACL
ncbi:Pol polyprotein [Elysia marginata]|uniref:Pol polyprotein n=1 Tax=Elysia marginata TaxID=1093978 RepID=A0AAV4JGF7_9GAST|nr:Pol polyprotein [Elysia marginata]